MKKIICTLQLVLFGFCAMAQSEHNTKDNAANKWEASVALGTINFKNSESLTVGDNINVGLTFEGLYKFDNNMFLSGGTTFSVIKNFEGLWQNTLNYFSINANAGYRFKTVTKTEPFIVPYVAVGTSFINAANTITNAKASVSANFTWGAIIKMKDAKWGMTIQNTYKAVNSASMVNHNQFTLGAAYKF